MTNILLSRWDPNAAIEAFSRFKVSILNWSVPQYISLLDHPDIKSCDFSSLRVCLGIPFGIPLTDDLLEKWENIT